MRFKRYMNEATAPLPKIEYNEIGLMTKDEFLKYQNEREKFHPSDAYDFTIHSMNQDYHISQVAHDRDRGDEWDLYRTAKKDGYFIEKNSRMVAVFINGIMYHTIYANSYEIPTTFFGYRDKIDLEVKKYVRIKYLTDKLKELSNVIANNYKHYPVLINRVKNFEGEYYEIRAEKKLAKDKGISMAMFNTNGEIVAIAQDEWGASLIVVAREYRGKGLGKIISKLWFDWNPEYRSGGFTAEGEKMSIGIWEDRVRKFLEYGWYDILIRKKKITKDKVSAILSGLREKKVYDKPIKAKKIMKEDPLYLIEYPSFVIYDKAFYEIEDYYTYDGTVENTIYAHGFLRSSDRIGTYVYSIDYEPKYHKIATTIILQMARDEGEKLYYGTGYTDVLELRGINVEKDGDYISLAKDELPLKNMASIEKRYRKQRDKYGELYDTILEAAESKWK